MAHETSVHRLDAEGVAGDPEPFEGGLAVDGIDEHLENLPSILGPNRPGVPGDDPPHCTDRDGEWLLRLGPDGLEVRREHAKGDIALRARRPPCSSFSAGSPPITVDVFGDPAALNRWTGSALLVGVAPLSPFDPAREIMAFRAS